MHLLLCQSSLSEMYKQKTKKFSAHCFHISALVQKSEMSWGVRTDPCCCDWTCDGNSVVSQVPVLVLLSLPLCPAGVVVCKTVPFVQTTAIVTGILTMTCIAIERYQGIVFPLKMRRHYSPKRAYKMLGTTHTVYIFHYISVLFSYPFFFFSVIKLVLMRFEGGFSIF